MAQVTVLVPHNFHEKWWSVFIFLIPPFIQYPRDDVLNLLATTNLVNILIIVICEEICHMSDIILPLRFNMAIVQQTRSTIRKRNLRLLGHRRGDNENIILLY